MTKRRAIIHKVPPANETEKRRVEAIADRTGRRAKGIDPKEALKKGLTPKGLPKFLRKGSTDPLATQAGMSRGVRRAFARMTRPSKPIARRTPLSVGFELKGRYYDYAPDGTLRERNPLLAKVAKWIGGR